MFKQMLVMGYQLLFGWMIFDIPGVDKLKSFFLRLTFNVGKNSYVRHGTYFNSSHAKLHGLGSLTIGNNVLIKHNCELDYSGGLTIEDNVRMAQYTSISTHGHFFKEKQLEAQQNISFSPLVIRKNVVIGSGAKILDSVNEIGEGAVIAAGAVVIKDVPPYTVMLGNPARPIFKRGEASVSE